jgi:uncharacterized membrane protein YqjE
MLGSVRELARTILSIVETRARIAATELEEQAVRLVEIAIWFALAILFFAVALVFFSLLVLIAFWDSHRLLAAGLLAIVYLAVGLAAMLVTRARLRDRPALFSSTLDELGKDLEQLEQKP